MIRLRWREDEGNLRRRTRTARLRVPQRMGASLLEVMTSPTTNSDICHKGEYECFCTIS